MRRLFTPASAVALALCVATVVLWVRSYWRTDEVFTYDPDGQGITMVARGRLIHIYQPYGAAYGGALRREWRIGQPSLAEGIESSPIETSAASFRSGHYFTSMAHDAEWWSVPFWWFAVPPAVFFVSFPWLRFIHARRVSRAGRCRIDAWDNPESRSVPPPADAPSAAPPSSDLPM